MTDKKTRYLRFFLTAILALPSTAVALRAQRTATTASAPETTTTQPSQPIYRYFPWFINGSSQTTGLAAVNLSSVPAELKFTARNDSGDTLATAETTLEPGNQIVKLAGELLPALGETTGWLIMESSVAGVEGFFLLFDYDLTVMDGSAVSGDILTDFVLPATEDGDLILVNPSNSSVVSTIQYRSELGLAALPMEVTLPPQGRVSAPIASYRLPGLRSGYLQVTGAGVVPLAVIGKPGWSAVFDAFDLSAASSSGFPRTLYAPQYAVGGGFATVMDFINLEDSNITLNLKLVGDDGTQMGRTGSVVLLPRGSTRISSSSIFGISPDSGPVQGYVEIRSNEGGFAGWVRFTDPEERSFGSALQCVPAGKALTHFSQVAQNDLFFYGVCGPEPKPADRCHGDHGV